MNRQTDFKNKQPITGGGEKTMKSSSGKYRLLFASTVAFLFVLLLNLGGYAAIDCNLTIPTASGVVNKNTVLNATFNVSSDATTKNMTVAFEARVSNSNSVVSGQYLTQNTSYSLIANVSNTSALRHTNLTFVDRFHFGDGVYTFRATCYMNGTQASGAQYSGVSSEVTATIDRSKPTCTYDSALTSGKEYPPNQKWLLTCKNASSATLQFGNNNPLTMTKNTDDCQFTGTKGSVPQTTYQTLKTVVSDGLNSTTCTLEAITIDVGAPLKQIAAIVASQGGEKASSPQQVAGNNNNMALIVVIALAAFGWYRMKRKGK